MPSVTCHLLKNIAWETSLHDSYSLSENIYIWRLQLPTNLQVSDTLMSILSPDEVIRAGSYLQEKDKQRFILSRAALRLILAKYLDKNAGDIRFAIGENKKPFVQNNVNVQYNVSHAGDFVLIAVSGYSTGIDIEHINTRLDYSEMLPLCFSSEEANYIQNREDFYLLWTRKEALLKATGKGLDDDLPYVPCMDGAHDALAEKIGSDKDWRVVSFITNNQYIASVACNPLIKNHLFLEVNLAS